MKMYKVAILYFPQIILMGVFMGPRTGNIDALNDAYDPPPCGNNASINPIG